MITIDPALFEFDDSLGYSPETFVMTGKFDQLMLLEALARVSERFLRVGQDGSEDWDPEKAAAADILTPSYVSDPHVTEQGIEIYVDGSGAIDPPMAETLRRVLREELEAVVDTARVLVVR